MAEDPSSAAMAVDAVAPAAEIGTSNADGRTSGADQQQQRSEDAAPTADVPQEVGDLTLVYKGQEHTFSGVPQRRVPSHADITTHCTCTRRHRVTPACLLRRHLSYMCQASCVRQLLCPRNRSHPATTDGHVPVCSQVALLLELLEDSGDFDAVQSEGLTPAEYRQVLLYTALLRHDSCMW